MPRGNKIDFDIKKEALKRVENHSTELHSVIIVFSINFFVIIKVV